MKQWGWVLLGLGLLTSPVAAQELTKSPNFVIETPTFSNGSNITNSTNYTAWGTLGNALNTAVTAKPAATRVPGKDLSATLIIQPPTVLADGQSQLAVIVLVVNGDQQPLANQTVTLATSRLDKDVIEPTQPITGINGVAIFKLKSQFSGQTDITASIGETVIGTGKATFFSVGRAFLIISSPLILLAGLFLIFDLGRWLWLLGWRRRRQD